MVYLSYFTLALAACFVGISYACLPNFFDIFNPFRPFNCAVLKTHQPNTPSGFYNIYPFIHSPEQFVRAYCDQETDGGGWTVIQKRDAAATRVNFYQNWTQYEDGFGNLDEYWLGLKAIHALTSVNKTMLKIKLVSATGQVAYPEYGVFHVGGPSQKYTLTVSDFSGSGGDSLINEHNGQFFSTFDQDFDKSTSVNCAQSSKGGWWYNSCHDSNLNGFQYVGELENGQEDGILWKSWEGFEDHSLAQVFMMIKPTTKFI